MVGGFSFDLLASDDSLWAFHEGESLGEHEQFLGDELKSCG